VEGGKGKRLKYERGGGSLLGKRKRYGLVFKKEEREKHETENYKVGRPRGNSKPDSMGIRTLSNRVRRRENWPNLLPEKRNRIWSLLLQDTVNKKEGEAMYGTQ